ncbi:MAG: MBL fold metallo-hydrolase [Chloroflexota bacterium]
MIRHVKDDLYQIGEHVSGDYGREAVNVYLLLNEDQPILVDCGSHLHKVSIMAEMDEVLDGRIPEYIFLTHSELPHAGNIASVADKWPGIKVIVSNVMLPYIEVLPVLPLSQITQVVPGHTIDCATRTLYFVDALLKDQPGSQWVYDSRTGTIFTGDGFGYYTTDAEMEHFSDEIEGGVAASQFEAYHKTAFHYLRWIKPDLFNADLDKMFSRRPISVIAPIHGNAIRGEVPTHVGRMKSAIEEICRSYR